MSNPNPWPDFGEAAALLVIVRFRVSPDARSTWLAGAERVLVIFARQSGFQCASIGQSTDETDLLLLRSEWDSVGDYRRALSDMDMKMHGIPFMAQAIDEPSAYELLQHSEGDTDITSVSGRARDADDVRLGRAAAAHVAPVTSRSDEL
ncbi:MAG: antibiotic biosynthesis monooxygenase [Candidatus Nanopelagicales bacterium]|nr:antibiotic biosynthesis monooxygenase [Candidatus Nanopelagicales bacterium]